MSDIGKMVDERIRIIRTNKGLSQEQLAFRAEINTSYLGTVERGVKRPTLKVLDRIAAALDASFEDIFTFEYKEHVLEESQTLEKIKTQLNNRSKEDKDFIYNAIKQLLNWKDRGQ